MKELRDVALRGEIVALHDTGKTPTQISQQLGISRVTVYKWIRINDSEGGLHTAPRYGRPRETTADEDSKIVEASNNKPMSSAAQIHRNLKLKTSVYTIRRRLHEVGVHPRIPASKPDLTPAHKDKRLQFAMKYA